MGNIPDGYFVVGNKLMTRCTDCGKFVRMDKRILGGLHFCVEVEPQQRHQMPFRQNREVTAKS